MEAEQAKTHPFSLLSPKLRNRIFFGGGVSEYTKEDTNLKGFFFDKFCLFYTQDNVKFLSSANECPSLEGY